MNKIITHLVIEKIHPMAKGTIEVLFHLLTVAVLSLEISSHFPSEPIIKLAIEKLNTPFAYSLVGVDLDQEYSLEYLKIYPLFDSPVKQAKFQYDRYVEKVNLQENKIEQPKAYVISKELLQKELGDDNILFRFLYNERFKFDFLFEGEKGDTSSQPQFDCQVVALKDNLFGHIKGNVPCKVVEKDALSFFAKVNIYVVLGILWYIFAAIFLRKIWKQKQAQTPKKPGETHFQETGNGFRKSKKR
jgi:hypothetical protein